jgi:hypothetical protein
MALSLSPPARDKLKSLAICFSLGNLLFIRRWYDLEHLQARSVDYYRTGQPDLTLLIATVIAAVLFGAVVWMGWLFVERSNSSRIRLAAQCVFLLLLVFPLESVRRYWNVLLGFDIGTNLALLFVEALLAAGLVAALLGNLRVLGAARRMTLLLTLLFPSLLIDLALARAGAEPVLVYQPKPPLPLLPPHPGPQRRVVWLLFDEFDQRLAFDERQPSVQLPELDRLRTESMIANHATQTAPWTILALPSLLSGRIYSRAEMVDAETLEVFPEGSRQGFSWRTQPNVFRRARELGLNAELVGWHHPYCRVFGDSLVRCLDVPSGHPTAALLRETHAAEDGIAKTVPYLFRLQWENLADMFRPRSKAVSENLKDAYVQRRQLRQYFLIRDRAYAEAADRQIDFLFVHFPTPHSFAIYDRRRRDFTLSASIDYFDNLALVDRTVGELRLALEQAGLWESTSLLITSDHGLRPELWRGRYNWTPELERLTENGPSETVPFIVKLAGHGKAAVYDRPFSNVVAGDLCLAILRGGVSTPEEAAAWLASHSTVNTTSTKDIPGNR